MTEKKTTLFHSIKEPQISLELPDNDVKVDFAELKLTSFQIEMIKKITYLYSIPLQVDPTILFYLGLKILLKWQRHYKRFVYELDFMTPDVRGKVI